MPAKKSIKAKKATSSITKRINNQNKPSRKLIKNYAKRKYLLLITLFVLIILIVSSILFIFRDQIIVATVNDEPILRTTLINELEKQSGKRVLENIVTKILVIQEAKKKNVSVSNSDIDSEIKKIEDNLKTQGQTLENVLKLQGATLATVKEQIKLNLLMKKLLGKEIIVTDKEVSDYVEKNKESKPENVKEEDYKKQIKTQLEQQKFQEKAQAYLKKLQDNAKINYYFNL